MRGTGGPLSDPGMLCREEETRERDGFSTSQPRLKKLSGRFSCSNCLWKPSET